METLKTIHNNKTLRQDLIILAIGMICVIAGTAIASLAGEYLVYDDFYENPYSAKYLVTGPLAAQLNGNDFPLTIVEIFTAGAGPIGIAAVVTGYKNITIYTVSTDSGVILDLENEEIKPPLIFYFDPPSARSTVQMMLGDELGGMIFSPDYTGLEGDFIGLGLVEVYYHEFAGPEFSWNYYAFNETGSSHVLGKMYHDVTCGLLFTAWFYTPVNGTAGLSTIDMMETNYGIRKNIYILVMAFIPLFVGWGVFHLWRLKKHPEDKYMELNKVNIVKFFIRLLAWPIFDIAGTFTGLTQLHYYLIDAIGFLLMLFAVGIFAIFVLMKFIHFVPGVEHPYGVSLYLMATLAYIIYQLGKHQAKKEAKEEKKS
ncbi:MAG: hypothetical protein ACFFDN_34355 [Candidatus Hodarchaeota archaeon]